LCISSGGDPLWFGGDGKVGYAGGGTFLLLASEETEVLKLFGKIDSLIHDKKGTP
jgi:hypothetical protein